MSLNKKALELTGVTERDYRKWCKREKRKAADINSKYLFFKLIQEGKLVKNEKGLVVDVNEK